MESGVKMIFTVMPMFCTCHLVKQCVNTLDSREYECRLFIVLWSYMLQMCKNLKGNVVKQGGKINFMQLLYFIHIHHV